MNYRFRKKPVVIEAFQMTEARRWDNAEWPNWLNEAWNKAPQADGAVFCGANFEFIAGAEPLFVMTLEGPHRINWDDWIIRGVQGELYPCKPDIFAATYESAE
jgi:hypothetical protein